MKILIAIANYGTKNDGFLHKVLEEFHSLPYETKLVVNTNVAKDLGPEVEVMVGLPTADPRSLVFAHRSLFLKHANDYDLFIYTEDDILITQEHIKSFLEVTSYLPDNKVAGLVRYEVGSDNSINMLDIHGSFHWWSESVESIDPYIFAEFSNKHSGAYILTRSQLLVALDSGNYALVPERSRYGVLESGASDLFHYCNLNKIICISHLDKFLVHHLSNKYIENLGISKKELDVQINALTRIASGNLPKSRLVTTETKLLERRFDLPYYDGKSDLRVVREVGSRRKNVLTIGSGSGETEKALINCGHQVTTVPLDMVVAQTLQEKGIETTVSDFEKAIDYLSGQKFDYIIFDSVLQYVPDPKGCLKGFLKLLDDQGKIVATFWNGKCRQFSSDISTAFDPTANGSQDFDTLGIHLTDKQTVRPWFQCNELSIKRVSSYQVPRGLRKFSWLSLGILDSTIARRLIVVAKRRK